LWIYRLLPVPERPKNSINRPCETVRVHFQIDRNKREIAPSGYKRTYAKAVIDLDTGKQKHR
ncbi:MAG: hypothetical protein KDI42_10500, partial [Gammaproteobacteria bacterium]|nr:hypothetical protein [Gammaproteobacteria bacterium]